VSDFIPTRIAIIGSAKLSVQQFKTAARLIDMIIVWESSHNPEIIIVSGGADGVDKLAETTAYNRGIRYDIYLPEHQTWEFFKKRNIEIAENCDVLYRIANVDTKTYGSGWTADYAEKLGVPVERIYI